MAQERIPGVSQQEYNALPFAVRAYIEFLERTVESQAKRIAELEARNAALEERVARLEAQLSKNSSNSHKPPSSDGPGAPPRTQSERKPSGKKPGGQRGHSGSTLRKSANPDRRVRHPVKACSGCNRDLSHRKPDDILERQIFDLPPLKIEVTSHEVEVKSCPGCEATTQASWPQELQMESGAAIYGVTLRSFAVYLTQGQLLPVSRSRDLIEDLWGHRISTGTLMNWTEKASDALEETDRAIADQLAADSGSIHFDETGVQVEANNAWLHSASSLSLTHYQAHPERGGEAIERMGILPRFKGTAIHDRYSPYFKYEECRHGLCGSHLMRDLRFVREQEGERWAGSMRRLLTRMNDDLHEAKGRGATRFNRPTIRYWEDRYHRIIDTGLKLHVEKDRVEGKLAVHRDEKRGRKKQRKGKNLLDALKKRADWVLLFIKDFTVPFTNNQGERDIRMTKVKLKVSGCFRSWKGARQFCRIRGYLSTAKKQGWRLLEAMRAVFLGQPLQPRLMAP
jgi:transposase